MENKALSRREREKLWQRQQILDAAIDLFSQKGYPNVSMHEIAEKSEFAIGTLYKFFQNKEHLYRELILEHSENFHKAVMKALEEPVKEVEKLREYVRAKGEVFRNNLPLIRLFLAENRGASCNLRSSLEGEMRERYCTSLDKLASIIEAGIKNKRFKKIADPYHVAIALDNAVNAFLFLWLEEPERHPYPDNPDTILNIFFEGLLNS